MFVIGICKNDLYALEHMRKIIVNYLNERQIRNIVIAYQNENDYFEDKLKFDLLFIEIDFFITSKISNIDVKTKIVYISNQAHKLKNKIHTSSQENTEDIYQIINEIMNLKQYSFCTSFACN